MRTRNPEQRLRAFLALCGGRRFDEETGAPQPAYKMDSMRIMAEFPKPKARARLLLAGPGPQAAPAFKLSQCVCHRMIQRWVAAFWMVTLSWPLHILAPSMATT